MRHTYKFLFPALLMLVLTSSRAFGDNWPVGARHAGMGYTGVAYGGIWGVYHNQAALAGIEGFGFGAYFQNNFNINELSVKAASFTLPVFNGVAGAAFTHFGYSGYSETKFGLAYAMELGDKLEAGIQIDYFNTHIANEFGNEGTPTGEMGIRYQPFENLVFGAHVFNPFRAKLSGYQDERLPTFFRAGVAYTFANRFLLTAEGVQDMNQHTELRVGAEYYALDHLFLRAGFSTNPGVVHFGIGAAFTGIDANISFSRHPVLDYATHLGITYRIAKNEGGETSMTGF